MNLGRHNYEEYFILYMDNELKPAERSMVESFVQLHPDLKEELDLLMQFKLEPDESVVFEAKDDLLKKISVPAVNESNYNEWLLLYVDNELTAPEKLLVDQFLANHPIAQKEWALLEKTRLQAEPVVFADKSSLYRTEKLKTMPVRPSLRQAFGGRRWRRVAAAAVLLLGIGLTTAILVNRKANPKDEIVNTNPGEQKDQQEIIAPKQAPVVADNNSIEEKPEPRVELKKPSLVVENKNSDPDSYRELIPDNKKEDVVAVIKEELPTNNLPKPVEARYLEPTKTANNVAVTDTRTSEIPLRHAVTIEHAPPSDNIEDPEEPGKKTKLRGLFRKVARTFEKRTGIATADEDNKLLVAGLAFKLK